MLDQYVIERTIGEGGSGTVVQARQKSADRPVAIKILSHLLLADENSRQRFGREAKTLCTLDHPNIVKVYSSGISDDGRPFFVMEYLDGKTLSAVLKDGRLSLRRFESIMTQVCAALEYAHKNGIVHRDIKPANIMLIQEADNVEFVKLLDFGIARKQDSDDKPGGRITQTGALIGSPAYMSPEQCKGQIPDARSDIYSLGCVMYECLIGRPPFQSQNVAETLMQHLNEAPTPMTVAASGLVLPPALMELIHSCLAKSPAQRPASAAELSKQLQQACQEKAIAYGSISAKQKKQKLYIAAAAILIIILAACGLNSFLQKDRESKAAASTVSSFITVDRLISKADEEYHSNDFYNSITHYLQAIKMCEDIEKVRGRSMKSASKLFDSYRHVNHARLKYKGYDQNDVEDWKQILATGIITFGSLSNEVAEAQYEVAKRITLDPKSTTAQIQAAEDLLNKSISYYYKRINSISEEPMVRIRAEKHILADEGRLSADLAMLARVYDRQDRNQEALKQLEQALKIDRNILFVPEKEHSLPSLQTMASACRIYHKTDKQKEQKALEDILKVMKNDPRVDNKDMVCVMSDLTNDYIEIADLKTAEQINNVMFELANKRKNAPTVKARAQYYKARILLQQGKKTEALKVANEARDTLNSCHAENHPIPSWLLLSSIYRELGAQKPAEECMETVARIEGSL